MKRKKKTGGKKRSVTITAILVIVLVIQLVSKYGGQTGGFITGSGSHYEIPRYVQPVSYDQLLERFSYYTSYNRKTLNPNWVGWRLTADHTDGEFVRKGYSFTEDRDVPAPRALYSDIREGDTGYQRGHMCPAGDNKWAEEAQRDAFLMTNISPQAGDLNQRDWKYLEEECRVWAKRYGQVWIVCGPVFYSSRYTTIGENGVAVPDAFFKVVLAFNQGAPQAIGFLYENKEGHHKMSYYARSVDSIEEITGLDFFHELDDVAEQLIEAQTDFVDWRLPNKP